MEGLIRMKTDGFRAARRSTLAILAALAMAVAACSTTGAGASAGLETEASTPSASASVPASAAPAASAESGGGRGDYDYETTTTQAPDASPAATAVTINVASGQLGEHLTGAGGLTLYTFKPDGPESSACDGGCAEAWPPFIVEAGTEPAAGEGVRGALSTFARSDGTLQVAYSGAPLYYFAIVSTPGDTNGQGLGDNWFIAKP